MVSSMDSWGERRERNGGGGKRHREKDSMGSVTGHTETSRQCEDSVY